MKDELPKGWHWTRLGDLVDNPKQDLVDGPFGSNLKSEEYIESGIPVFKIQNIKVNRFVDKKMSFVTEEKAKSLIRHSFREGDLIITKLGEPLGLCCKVPSKYPFGIIVADLMRLRPSKSKVFDEYLINVINSDIVKKQFKAITKGTTRARVNLTIVRDIRIPLPPKPTQQAIVSKIEELFSELDKGIENLHLAQQQLKTYRQSVLKWAFEGKLTNENVNVGELPKDWKSIKISDLCKVVRGGSPRPAGDPKYYDGNIPFLKVADITKDEEMYLTTFKYTIKEAGLHKTRKIKPNTLLLSNSGATLGVPKVCMIDATMNDGIAAFLELDPRSNHYLYYFWLSKTRQLRNINMGAAQPNLNTDIIKDYDVPYCSFEEQNKIVLEIESRLSVADKMEEGITQSLQQAEALRQSILKKAFEGKLTN